MNSYFLNFSILWHLSIVTKPKWMYLMHMIHSLNIYLVLVFSTTGLVEFLYEDALFIFRFELHPSLFTFWEMTLTP